MVGKRSIAVIGAGALGSACAAVLAARGARVTLFDASDERPNASRVAAGMIAPAFEAVLEDAPPDRADLYRAAASLWPRFAADRRVRLVRDGAAWIGPTEGLIERFLRLGFAFQPTAQGLFTSEDFRVDPDEALTRLTAGTTRGGRVQTLFIETDGLRLTTDGAAQEFDAAVLATGWSSQGLRIEGPRADAVRGQLDRVTPIRGQILAVRGVSVERPTRGPGVYVVPRGASVLVGATMAPGSRDLAPDLQDTRRLLEAAAPVVPDIVDVPQDRISVAVGIRGGSPDGVPMAGRTAAARMFAALAPRRNGWLFAPMVAEVVARAIFDEPPEPVDHGLRPGRFDRRPTGPVR